MGEIKNIPDIGDINTSTQSMSSSKFIIDSSYTDNNVNSPQKELLAPPPPNQNAYQVGDVNYANNLVPPPPVPVCSFINN